MRHMPFRHHARLATALRLALLGLAMMLMCGSYPISTGLTRTRTGSRTLTDSDQITIGIWIPDRDLAGEQRLLSSLSRPDGPAYHQWLSPASFQERFAPAADDVATVRNFLTGEHLSLLPDSSSNLLLARGTISQVEEAFQTPINISGEYYESPGAPKVPATIARLITGVFGLTNRPLAVANASATPGSKRLDTIPASYGGGVKGGLTPSQIAGIYNTTPLYRQGNRGQGTTLGLLELSGYKGSDIAVYENAYHLPHMPLFDIPILGGPTNHSGAVEVELDIDFQIAMAPGARRMLIYSVPNTELGFITAYRRIAQDNLADAISTSWGQCEYAINSPLRQAENQAFLQMALQGQSMFAASGDNGAYDCTDITPPLLPSTGQELQVDDPGSQPYITSVGGTSFQGASNKPLFDPAKNQNPVYPGQLYEKPWSQNDCYVTKCSGTGGGGVSHVWGEPDYALNPATGTYYPGVIGGYSHAGAYCQQRVGVLCREVPDVSLNADSQTGYSLYCTDPGSCAKAGWGKVGGTSASAPLWAGIAALAIRQHQNQRLGLLNYLLYPFDSPAGYTHQLHDIISNARTGEAFQIGPLKDGQYHTISGYAATRAYDLATGLGTPDIAQLVEGIGRVSVFGKG